MALGDLLRGVGFAGSLSAEGCLAEVIRASQIVGRCVVYGTRRRPLRPWTRLNLTRREPICACAGSLTQCIGSVKLPFSRLDRQELMGPIAALAINVFLRARHSTSRSRERAMYPR